MKIIIVGATGTIGSKVTGDLQDGHEVIKVGSTSGDIQADITDSESIEELFEEVESFDALVSATGEGHFGSIHDMTEDDFRVGVNSKLMGQINLVLKGQDYINPNGSFTLISGILSEDPVYALSNLAAINGAINSFVKAASMELEEGVRINAVSPGVVEDSPEFFDAFPGHKPVAMDDVVLAYRKSILGKITGEVVKVY